VERLRAGEAPGARLPAIALTAYATPDDVKRALGAGYDLHVAKPVNAAQLADAIIDLVDGKARDAAQDTCPIFVSEHEADA